MSRALLRGRWLRCFIYQIEGIVKTNCACSGNQQMKTLWLGSPPVFAATWLHYDHRSRVTWTHRLWVFLRISTTWVDTGTPSFQTVVKHQQQSAKKKKAPFAFRGTKMNSGCFCFEGVYFSVTFHQRNTAVVYLRVCGHGCGLHVRLVCGLGRDAQR